LGKRLSDRKKSEIANLHFQGLTRDEIAKKTRVSAGAVSGVIKEFTDCAVSTSTEEAAEEYDVFETVENLRSLTVEIRKAGTNVEELMEVSKMLERIKKLIDLDRLEGFIKAGESLDDKTHVEASVRMHLLEEHTGKSHDDILVELERKNARLTEQSEEIQRRNAEIKNLEDKKARLTQEETEFLKQHKLTMDRVEHVSRIEETLSRYKIDLTKLDGLQRVLGAIEEADYDPKEVVEQIRKKGALQLQIEAHTKDLANIQAEAVKLNEVVSALEKKLAEAESTLEKYNELESMGWNRESLERALRLTREAGSPEEALNRLELLKPSAEAKAELERAKAEIETLKEKSLKTIKETLENLSTLAVESSKLVNEKIPIIVAEVNNIVKTQISGLANEYTNLAEKHGKLQEDFSKLDEEYRKLQKRLDDAVSWSLLLEEPEKLPGNSISRIFFDVMLPRLETWCRSKESTERVNIVTGVAKRAICLYTPQAANLMNQPEEASVADAIVALCSFVVVAMPFYEAFMTWYALHKNEAEASKLFNAQYHLKQFYDKGIPKL
jgi:chromosome segregation ATPase